MYPEAIIHTIKKNLSKIKIHCRYTNGLCIALRVKLLEAVQKYAKLSEMINTRMRWNIMRL